MEPIDLTTFAIGLPKSDDVLCLCYCPAYTHERFAVLRWCAPFTDDLGWYTSKNVQVPIEQVSAYRIIAE
jgi:hypothetical protein